MDEAFKPATPAPPAPSAPLAPATPVRSGLGLLLPLLWVGGLVLLLAGTVAGGLRWLLATDAGAAWLVQRLPGSVQLEGFRGALLGPQWQADRLRVQWDGGRQWVLIEGLQGRGLRWAWRPHAHAWVALDMDSLAARQITLHTLTAPASGPTPLPATLAPPVQLQLASLQVQTFVLDGQAPVQGLQLNGLQLDPRPGALHRVQAFALQAVGVNFSGAAELANAPPYALTAQAAARPTLGGDAPAWAAMARAQGTLPEVLLSATLRGRPPAAPARGTPAALAEAPSVDFKATLQPLQPWPLASLDLKTRALNLAALLPGLARAPTTQINGQATLQGGAGATPLQAEVMLDNLLPGRWNEGRLPLRRLTLEVNGSLQQRDRIALPRFEMELADTGGSAGRYSGSAVWQGGTLTLDTQLQAVAPQQLDGRAAAMTLTGPLALTLRGLPSPDMTAAASTAASTPASPAASAAAPAPLPTPAPSVSWKLDLQGRLAAAPQAVQLQLEGSADSQRLELRRATAQAGAASASLTATLQRVARGDWQLNTTGSVNEFDPVPWWPGEAGGAWRQGPHRLSGAWQFDLRLPRGAESLKPLELAQRLAGNGTLRLHDSVLAGVALAADVKLGYNPANSPAPGTVKVEVQLGGNTLSLDGRGDPGGAGQGDRWELALNAPRLASLGALSRLVPALAAWEPRGGQVQATLSAAGRWPEVRSEGKASLAQLQLGTLSVANGSARWQLATAGGQALTLQAEANDIRQGAIPAQTQTQTPGRAAQAPAPTPLRVQQLRADVSGTLAEHRIEVSAALPLAPPRAAEQALGLKLKSGTRALLRAAGAWLPAEAGGGKWKARVERLAIGPWDGAGTGSSPADNASWAEALDLRAEVDVDAQGSLQALQASPGSLRLGDVFALRWDEVRVDLRGAQPQLQMRASLEPFALAPLLARLQPDMGWQGDLRLGARLDIRAAEKMDADLVIERSDGDLHLVGTEGTQLMGLSEFRLAVSAHEGVWNFAPTLRGRSLGELTGRVTVQSTPERRWPEAAAAIAGEVRARVADLGIWGAWVPPGWRLAGALDSTAKVSGTFGKPQLDGLLTGQGLAVRNLLQGVNISDGQVLVKLAGDTAQVERFTLRAGEGLATISGAVTFGPKLQVAQGRLELKAERLRVLGRIDRSVIASGQAVASMQNERLQLDGKFRIDEGLFDASSSDAPSLDDDVTVRRAGSPEERQAAAEAPPARRSFVMGVDIDLGERLRVRGRGLDTGLRGLLRLTTPGGRLAVNGTITTDGGTYAAYGQKLEIERGIVAFSGAYDNPRVDVLALRPNIDQRVGVAITGNVLTPRVRLFAEPELSDSEKLSWLVLGRAPDGLGRNDTALIQRAAVALLSGEGEAPTDALMRSLGIDEVSLRQGDGDVRETVITVGKQLSRRWYLGYERGVNATTGTWQLIYRIAQRFTLRAQSGEDSALDLIWTWRMQETPADAGMRKSTLVPR